MVRSRKNLLGRVRRTALGLLGVAALAAPALAVTDARAAEPDDDQIVDVPVIFTVKNVNRSLVPCLTDGKTYTVRGHLTGPASELDDATADAGALYLHGLELGEWFWRFAAVGSGHVQEMASRGHVSITIDRLGYNSSDQPAGLQSCVGGQADIAHQIVEQLRAGTYVGAKHPSFGKVALLGHSLGGVIAQVAAYSFGDVDGVGVLSYADSALTPSVLATPLTWGPKCLLGGARSEAGSPGYAHLTRNQADFNKNFLSQTPASALPGAAAQWDLNPCGDLLSAVPAAGVSLVANNLIRVPVLVMSGSNDLVFDAKRVKLQSALYLSAPSRTVHIVPGATHGITLEPTATEFIDGIDAWLNANNIN